MEYNELDYSIDNYKERQKVVSKILKQNEEEINRYIDDVHKGQTDKICSEHFTCKGLENLASYLLKEEQEEDKKKETYKVEKNKSNFYLSKKTKISKNDYWINEIYLMQQGILKLSKLYNKNTTDAKQKYLIRQWIKDLEDNQILIKEMVTRPIDFKHICVSNVCMDYEWETEYWHYFIQNEHNTLDLFLPEHWRHILTILQFETGKELGKYKTAIGINEKIDAYIKMFNKIYSLCKTNSKERAIVRAYQKGKSTCYQELYDKNGKDCLLEVRDIAGRINETNKKTQVYIDRLCNKLSNAFAEYYENEIYYVYLAKGQYKKCSKCGQTKIVQQFSNKQDTADGLHTICKECENTEYKICTKCGQKLHISMFYERSDSKDGLYNYCKLCI